MRQFSDNNTPMYGYYGQSLPEALPQESSPPKIQRQTHEWSYYFGRYPSCCAQITNTSELTSLLEKGARHIYKGPVNRDLALSPSDVSVYLAKKNICEKIEMIKMQLDVLVEADILSYTSNAGRIEITMEELFILKFMACDDTGTFQIFIEGPEEPNKLIFVIRSIFDRNESPLVSNLEFDIEEAALLAKIDN